MSSCDSVAYYEKGKTPREIVARFNPDYDARHSRPTDAGKIAGGNRNGTSSERRMTLNHGTDYYELLADSTYLDSEPPKEEGDYIKDTHVGVKLWHYFVNEIYYAENDSDDMIPFNIEIHVKEKDDGAFVYSYEGHKKSEAPRRDSSYAQPKNGTQTYASYNGNIPSKAAIVNIDIPLSETYPEQAAADEAYRNSVNNANISDFCAFPSLSISCVLPSCAACLIRQATLADGNVP